MLLLSPDPGLLWAEAEGQSCGSPAPRLGSLIRPSAPSWVLEMKPNSNLKNKNSDTLHGVVIPEPYPDTLRWFAKPLGPDHASLLGRGLGGRSN